MFHDCIVIVPFIILMQQVGQKAVAVNRIQESLHLLEALSAENGGHVELGGWWKPENCVARADVSL